MSRMTNEEIDAKHREEAQATQEDIAKSLRRIALLLESDILRTVSGPAADERRTVVEIALWGARDP